MGNHTLTVQSFTLYSNKGIRLQGEIKTLDDGKPHPAIIISHGFRGHKDWAFWPEVTSRLAEEGFYTVSYNFSRIAANEDSLTEEAIAAASTFSQELDDLETVLHALSNGDLPEPKAADRAKIGLLGHSRAGGSSILTASEQPEAVAALAVWNGGPPPSRQPQAGEPASLLEQAVQEDWQRNEERFNIRAAFTRLQLPALIVQGDQDRKPLLEQLRFFQAEAPHQHYVLVQGADHTFNTVHPYEGANAQLQAALQATIDFFKKQLG
jgi:Dipeptidyl aminopeptidases/acylaminoacyl-peptidases